MENEQKNLRPIALKAGSAILSKLSVEELRTELASTLTITAKHLLHLADVWSELQRRGEDLSHLRSGLWQYMAMIASGSLQAELVVKYAGNATLLRHVASLPRYEQDILLKNDEILVVDLVDGEFKERRASLQSLRRSEIGRLLNGKVKTGVEQKKELDAARARTSRKIKATGRALVLESVRDYKGDKARVPRSLTISLSSSEWEMLKEFSEEQNVSLPSLIIGSLRTTGLLKQPRRK